MLSPAFAISSGGIPKDPLTSVRANPYPEVTDLICRLPLPTLFYRLEAVHLEDLMRKLVRSWKMKSLQLDFSRDARKVLDTSISMRCWIPIHLLRFSAWRNSTNRWMLTRKDNSSKTSARLHQTCTNATIPKRDINFPGAWILTCFPFARHRTNKINATHSAQNYPATKGRLTHVLLKFTWNLSSLQSSRVTFKYLLLPPRSAIPSPNQHVLTHDASRK